MVAALRGPLTNLLHQFTGCSFITDLDNQEYMVRLLASPHGLGYWLVGSPGLIPGYEPNKDNVHELIDLLRKTNGLLRVR